MAKTTTTTQTKPKTTTTSDRNPEVTHAIQHVEITTKDPAKLKKFLERQFNWTFTTATMPGMADYHSFRTPDGNGGGIVAPQMPDQPIACTPYINVTNCESSEKECKKNGATIILPTTEIPGVGKFFWFQVAGSPPLACFQSTTPQK